MKDVKGNSGRDGCIPFRVISVLLWSRFGRDDKGEGGASIQIGCRGGLTAGPFTSLRYGRDDTSVRNGQKNE